MANDFKIPPIVPTGSMESPLQDLKYPTFTPSLQIITPFLFKIPSEPQDTTDLTSYLGTPVYSNLVFKGLNQTDNVKGDANSNSLRIDTVLMNVHQTKNVVRTPIAGKNGTIKTYISMGDFEVSIMGALVSPYALQYPGSDLTILEAYMEAAEPVQVESEFLNYFGIDHIVILDYDIGQKMGSRNEVPFTIQAVSDFTSIDYNGYSWVTK